MLSAFVRAPWVARAFRVALPALLLASAGQVCARTYTVSMEGVQFVPTSLEVKPGDVIVWKNKDPFPHTVTAVNRQFDSGEMPAGGEWRWVAKQAGEFRYFCTLHTTMKASVTVRKTPSSQSRRQEPK